MAKRLPDVSKDPIISDLEKEMIDVQKRIDALKVTMEQLKTDFEKRVKVLGHGKARGRHYRLMKVTQSSGYDTLRLARDFNVTRTVLDHYKRPSKVFYRVVKVTK